VLKGDPRRIAQILLNLVGNAIKFTKQGSVKIAVSHRALEDDAIELRVEVADTGAGIPAEVKPFLFNPFHAGRQFDIAEIRRHRAGPCDLQAALPDPGRRYRRRKRAWPGQFVFTVKCRAGLPPAATAPSLAPTIEVSTAAIDILVAEDNETIRTLVTKLLARRGYRADVVCNGMEAIAAVQKKSYHLVLMDMQMPVMDGIAATVAIRRLSGAERTVPIIALTANALVGQREICLAAGMNSFLTKPIQPDALDATILRWGVQSDQTRHKAGSSIDG
jgi:CheY-like chemotaxis protein